MPPPKRRPAKAPAKPSTSGTAPATHQSPRIHQPENPPDNSGRFSVDDFHRGFAELRMLWVEMRAELERMKACQLADLYRNTEKWQEKALVHAEAELILTANENKLKTRIADLEKDCADYCAMVDQGKKEYKRLSDECDELRCRLWELDPSEAPAPQPAVPPSAQPPSAGQSPVQQAPAPNPFERPTTYAAIPDWVRIRFPGKLVLLPRAVRSLANALYDDVGMVCRVLELLADEYRRMRLGQFSKPEFQRVLHKLRLRWSRSITPSRAGEEQDEYFVTYPEGSNQRRFVDSHLRNITMTRQPEKCLAVYFFWDKKEKLVVVASLPGHLDNRLT